jgi:hypothetical protein
MTDWATTYAAARQADPALFEPTQRSAPSPERQPQVGASAAWASWVDERIRAYIGTFAGDVGSQVRRLLDESTAKSVAPLQERCDRLEAENATLRARLAAVEAQEPDLSPLEAKAAAAVGRAIAPLDAALAAMPRSILLDGGGDLVCVRGDGSTESLGHVQGKDGVTPPGIDDIVVDDDGNLVVRMTDGRMIARGRVRGEQGRDGRDGTDGEPGLGFDDLDVDYDGYRTMTLRWQRGERVVEKSFTLPVIIYQGIWKEGVDYSAGDATTFSGGIWVAREATRDKPGDGPSAWTLATKPGRNGKSAFDLARAHGWTGTSEKEWLASLRGAEGRQGPPGVPGRDRT